MTNKETAVATYVAGTRNYPIQRAVLSEKLENTKLE